MKSFNLSPLDLRALEVALKVLPSGSLPSAPSNIMAFGSFLTNGFKGPLKKGTVRLGAHMTNSLFFEIVISKGQF